MEKKEAVKAFLGEKIIYDEMGQYIWGVLKNGHHQKIADLRGWGAIQNMFVLKNGTIDMEKASKFQDDLGKLIAKTLNDTLLSPSTDSSEVSEEEIEKEYDKFYSDLKNVPDLSYRRGVKIHACEFAKWMRSKLKSQWVSVDKWISCEKRTPEDYQEVLIYACTKQGLEVLTAMFCDDTDGQYYIKNWNKKTQGNIKDCEIIYWKPNVLPEIK